MNYRVVEDPILSLIGPYIYHDKEVLDSFICEALSVVADDIRRSTEQVERGKLRVPEARLTGGDSTTEYESSDEENSDLSRQKFQERARARKALAPGQCYRCRVQETPQWRYVHHLRFCNACYMRIKRYTEQARPGSRLPPRAKPSSLDDTNLAQLAVDLAEAAFA